MDNFKIKTPSVVLEAQKGKLSGSLTLQIVIFLAVSLVSTVVQSIPLIVAMLPDLFKMMNEMSASGLNPSDSGDVMKYSLNFESSPLIIITSLYSTLLGTILVLLFCRFIQKRSLYSVGFVRKKAAADYFLGLLIGAVMFSAAVFICWATGSLKLKDEFLSGGAGIIIIYFFGFFFQGMYEEVIFRGYFMTEIAAKKTIPLAIITNSVIFAVFHGMNPGVSVLAIINLVLFGVFASIFFLKSDSIWGICAIHSIWNFVQGNFYGIKVSGIDGINSVFRFESVSGKELINGGNFGLEGGLGVTIVLTAGVIIMLLIKGKCSELAASENETNPEIQ